MSFVDSHRRRFSLTQQQYKIIEPDFSQIPYNLEGTHSADTSTAKTSETLAILNLLKPTPRHNPSSLAGLSLSFFIPHLQSFNITSSYAPEQNA
jgi:hypothetical protein